MTFWVVDCGRYTGVNRREFPFSPYWLIRLSPFRTVNAKLSPIDSEAGTTTLHQFQLDWKDVNRAPPSAVVGIGNALEQPIQTEWNMQIVLVGIGLPPLLLLLLLLSLLSYPRSVPPLLEGEARFYCLVLSLWRIERRSQRWKLQLIDCATFCRRNLWYVVGWYGWESECGE